MAKKPSLPIELPDDPLPFRAAIAWCRGLGLPLTRCSPYQLKTGPWNLYTNGTFQLDGHPGRKGCGLAAFKLAIEVWIAEEGLAEALKR